MKKILFTTVCNDRYLPGLLVFLFSFKKHHPTWNYPFKVYHRDDLSERSIKQLKIVYPNLIFELITDPKFYDKEAHYMCLLPFKEYDYDQVIFLDCDMLCLGPIDDILNVKTGLAACLEYKFKFPKKHIIHSLPYLFRPLIHFNTGVFSVKKPLLNEKTYNKLVSLIDKNILKRKKLWDQDIINEAFRFEKKSILPFTFNPKKKRIQVLFQP